MPTNSNANEILEGLQAELKGFVKRQDSKLQEFEHRLDNFEVKASRPRGDGGGSITDAVVQQLVTDPGFQQISKSGRGRTIVQCKNLLLETKTTPTLSTDLVAPAGLRGIGDSGRPVYGGVRRLLQTLPIDAGAATFVRETSMGGGAGAQSPEGGEKDESTFGFVAETKPVATIATWSAVSKQALDDVVSLGEHIRGSLLYNLEKEFETELLFGAGTANLLTGLSVDAQPFDVSVLTASDGYEYYDILAGAAQQLRADGFGCNGFIVSPDDAWKIRRAKDSTGRYIFDGATGGAGPLVLWGCPVVESAALSSHHFLAGDFATGAHIRMRLDMTLDISDSHADFFIQNLLCLRAELRAVLCITKPAAWVYGTMTQSPA
jgi:HK97 family phage major capsid protein